MRRFLILLMLLVAIAPCGLAEEEDISLWDIVDFNVQNPAITPEPSQETPENDLPVDSQAEEQSPAREDLINRYLEVGHQLFIDANGRSKRASKKGDIYLCKNFTTHVFNEVRADFCMAEYPDVQLRVPDNLPKEDCKPYSYGFLWKDVGAEEGNPFYVAAQFRYDTKLSRTENLELAKAFMRQAQRGDYFQMSADYEHGVGAHSAIMLGYDAAKDEIHWMDSNMLGRRDSSGVRYGYVQYDAVKSVDWWAKAFCVRTRGATLYRLRDDIAYRED